jgi:type IV conjugative transfer system protein TraL
MSDFNKSYIPQNLDVAEKFLIWGYDQLAFFMLGMFIGHMISDINTGLVLGLIVSYLYTKLLKQGAHPHFWKHLMYWFLPKEMSSIGGKRLKKTPPSEIRRWLL